LLHFKSFALYVTLADWLWPEPESITQRFCLCVCIWLRMRTIASISQSAWTIIYVDLCVVHLSSVGRMSADRSRPHPSAARSGAHPRVQRSVERPSDESIISQSSVHR